MAEDEPGWDDEAATSQGGREEDAGVRGRVATWVVDRSRTVVLGFLAVTVVLGLGLGAVSTEAGTSQFTEATDAQDALDAVNQQFQPRTGGENATTQLVQRGPNVLARGQLLASLRAVDRLEAEPSLFVVGTASPAATVARTLDPDATTTERQIDALEGATAAEIDAAVRRAADRPGFRRRLGDDFTPASASASASITVMTHRLPVELDAAAGGSQSSPLTPIQVRARSLVAPVDADVTVFGAGIVAAEFRTVIGDSLAVVVPAAVLLILFFLVVAYRDPIDLLLGTLALAMTLVWTLGFMGLAGIAFSQMLIAVPPLLLAVGIDFGIHTINRYREERVTGESVAAALRTAFDQLLVAFFIVTATTVVGFAANLTSDLAPIRDFGLVAAVGIAFTFCIFGVFLPAAKAVADRYRARHDVPEFGSQPLGREGSLLGRVLTVGVVPARRAPKTFLLVVLLVSAGAGYYATGVDTTFSDEDFLPPAEVSPVLESLPEPFAPSEYTVTETIDFLEANFAASADDRFVVYLEGPLRADDALDSIQMAATDPPEPLVAANRTAEYESVIGVVRAYAERSPEFRRLVDRTDRDGDGVPEDDLGRVYDALFASPLGDEARRFLTADRRNAQVIYTTRSDATQDEVTAAARAVADRYRVEAVPTGEIVVFQSISDLILASALRSLVVALLGTAVVLFVLFRRFTGSASLGAVTLVPILVSVALIAGSMRLFGVPFNALTATVLAITIGLGVDYAAHVVHRFADEYGAESPDSAGRVAANGGEDSPASTESGALPAIERTVRGTGGALAGSMLTTASGLGVLILAYTPILGQFGLVVALSIVYSFVVAVLVTPSVLVLWDRRVGDRSVARPPN